MSTLNEVLKQLLSLTEDKRLQVLKWYQDNDPEHAKQLDQLLKAQPGRVHEARGYEHWLRLLGSHTFTSPFAWFHHKFWEWYWPLAIQVQEGIEPNINDLVCMLPWSRDTGKSSHTEWAAIAEGALVHKGYVLWVSAKQLQAEEHVTSIRNRIESEKVAKYYPWLSTPKVGTHGNKFGWGKEFLMTKGGWAVRPAGLDAYLRGGKILDMRPSLIVVSDVDEIGDSPVVVQNKLQMLTRSILPMGAPFTRIIFDQNPIHANSVMNQILTRATTALAVRRIIGIDDQPIPAFKDIEIEHQQTEHGPRHIIVSGTPTWEEMDLKKCQAFLDRSGLEAFMAEYQHDLEIALEERVLPEYDDRVTMAHVITWDQFEAKYGMRRIPSNWPADCGLDIGYSEGHKSAWTFLSKVPLGSDLSGSILRYRGRTFTGVGIDDQAISIRSELWPDERIQRELMSHEKLGERITLNTKHGWHFHPCDSAKESGIPQWRHYLRVDKRRPHPFHRDEKDEHGLWKIGCPSWFDIVDSKQFRSPVDDHGLKRHRDSAYNWRRVPIKLTEKGVTVDQPAKINDDEADSTRSLLASTSFGPVDQPMTAAQRLQSAIPVGYHASELAQRTDMDANQKHLTEQMAIYLASRQIKQPPKLYDHYGNPLR